MVWMSWKSVRGWGAIASLGLLAMACQPTTESRPLEDEAELPGAAPVETSEGSPPADEATAAPATNPDGGGAIAAATPQQSCSAAAYVVDTDPAGLNVRSGPGSDFDAQNTLPTGVPVEVEIVGATGEWVLINQAWSGEQQELAQPGWVYAPLLGVSTTSLNITDPEAPTTLYAAPDGNAAIAATISKGAEVTLLGCSGNWLQVKAPEATGWLAVGEQCSNPVSTCP